MNYVATVHRHKLYVLEYNELKLNLLEEMFIGNEYQFVWREFDKDLNELLDKYKLKFEDIKYGSPIEAVAQHVEDNKFKKLVDEQNISLINKEMLDKWKELIENFLHKKNKP